MAAGGLHVVGTERHESRRIDNQVNLISLCQSIGEIATLINSFSSLVHDFDFISGVVESFAFYFTCSCVAVVAGKVTLEVPDFF